MIQNELFMIRSLFTQYLWMKSAIGRCISDSFKVAATGLCASHEIRDRIAHHTVPCTHWVLQRWLWNIHPYLKDKGGYSSELQISVCSWLKDRRDCLGRAVGQLGFLPLTRLLHTGNGETTTGMIVRPAASSPRRCKNGSRSLGQGCR